MENLWFVILSLPLLGAVGLGFMGRVRDNLGIFLVRIHRHMYAADSSRRLFQKWKLWQFSFLCVRDQWKHAIFYTSRRYYDDFHNNTYNLKSERVNVNLEYYIISPNFPNSFPNNYEQVIISNGAVARIIHTFLFVADVAIAVNKWTSFHPRILQFWHDEFNFYNFDFSKWNWTTSWKLFRLCSDRWWNIHQPVL